MTPKRTAVAAAVACVFAVGPVLANGTNPSVVAGQAGFSTAGKSLNVTNSPGAIINWQGFSIGADETTRFIQQGAASSVLNRVLGPDPSVILGALSSIGRVFLINPSGILFGQGARIDVAGLVASTLELSNQDYLAGRLNFTPNALAGEVVNQGTITTPSGGSVYLVGSNVSNSGLIASPQGDVILAAGQSVKIFDSSTPGVRVELTAGDNAAVNLGEIIAHSGQVGIYGAALRNAGIIDANQAVRDASGKIVLRAKQDVTLEAGSRLSANAINSGNGGRIAVWSGGDTSIGGTLTVRGGANSGDGGLIETSGHNLSIAESARVNTLASHGKTGAWLIDPQDFTVAASGGDITGSALSASLGTTNVEVQSSTGGTAGSGNVNVNDVVSWSANNTLTLTASNNVNINADITATGNTAGLVINPNTANGADPASGTGVFNLNGASVTLSGGNPSLAIAGATYTVINDLGAAGSTTAADLQGMNGDVTANYALGSNIDAAATSGWNAGAGFVPIGNAIQFSGAFDGLGHTISNLVINPGTNNVGLFGNTSGANLQNVGLIDSTVTGGANTGALVGNKAVGNISNAYSTGTVRGTSYVGGLVGLSNGGNLTNTYSTAAVFGTANLVGGLAGQARFFGTITNSYATGAVSAPSSTYVGGLVGQARFVNLVNTYATGAVAGNGAVGGLVGFLDGTTIATSYSAGAVSGNFSLGGLVGQSNSSVTNSYWNVTRSGRATSAGGTGLADAQMFTAANFSGFSFTRTPGLTGNNWVIVDVDGSVNNAAGAAGATFPMLASEYSTTIANAHQLQLMAMAPAARYTLGNDVNAAATALSGGVSTEVWGSSGFAPIGNLTTPFTGTFDGLGHTVSTLTILLATPNVGLIGATGSAAVIRNVGLVDASVTGGAGAGALVGNNGIGTSISNSYSSGSVSGGAGTGGLVGSSTTSPISNSYSTSSVSGAAGTGGLLGSNTSGAISTSYATGSVTGAAGTGGLIGSNTSGPVSKSYATGSVTGAAGTGGLIGSNTSGVIDNSYATGNVDGGTGAGVGGLIGSNTSGTVTNSYSAGGVSGTGAGRGALIGSSNANVVFTSYWDKTTSIAASSVGGGIGMTTAEMQTQADFTSSTTANSPDNPAWDFSGTWVMYEGHTYPLLQSLMTPLTVTANDASKTYGQANPAFGVSYSSVPNGNLLGTVSYSGTAQTAIYPGNYVITPSGLYSESYIISYANGTLTVGKASLTATADDKSKTYGGADPALTYTPSGTLYYTDSYGVIGGVTLATDTGALATAGTHTITASGGAAANYDVTMVDGTLTVGKASLTATADDKSKTYGGADPALTYTPSGTLFYSDTAAVVFSGALTRVSGETVLGAPYAIAQGTLTANGNYTLSSFTGNTLTITPAPLDVAANPQSKLFGTPDPALTFGVMGLVNNPALGIADTAAVVLSGALTRVPGESALGGPYAITQGSLAANGNYALGFTPNNLIVIGAAAEPVLGFNVEQVVFAGVVNYEFYYRPGNFWHISLNPNNADPGFDVMRGTGDLKSRLGDRLNRCDSVSGGGFCETWSFPQQRK